MLAKMALMDSHVIRALLVAIAGLVGIAISMFSAGNATAFNSHAPGAIDALMLLFTTAAVAYAAYARLMRPTPPITDTAVAATVALAAKQTMQPSVPIALYPTLLPCLLVMGLALSLLGLTGCAALGGEPSKGFADSAYTTEQAVNGVIAAATNSLDAGTIKSSDAEYVRKTATDVRAFLGSAETAFAAGDTTTANARLALAIGVLRELQLYVKPTAKAKGTP
jgi:hypothetical protein